MKEIFDTVRAIALGIGALLLVLLALYAFTLIFPSKWRNRFQSALFVLPALIVILAGLLVPALKTVLRAFLNDAQRHAKWVGLRNFKEIFTQPANIQVVLNTLTWVIVGTIVVVIVALTIARFTDGMRGERVAKSFTFIPTCVSLAGAGIIWRFVYAGPPFKVGLLNSITKGLHLPTSLGGDGARLWITETGLGPVNRAPDWAPGFNTFLLVIIFIWASTGIATMIFSAAIKGVPEPLIEAAKVDGATDRQVFYKVTVPYIRSTIVTVATLTVIAAFKSFDIIQGASGGIAGTTNIATEWYNQFFLQDRDGLASALATLLFILVIPAVVINRRSQKRAEELMKA